MAANLQVLDRKLNLPESRNNLVESGKSSKDIYAIKELVQKQMFHLFSHYVKHWAAQEAVYNSLFFPYIPVLIPAVLFFTSKSGLGCFNSCLELHFL